MVPGRAAVGKAEEELTLIEVAEVEVIAAERVEVNAELLKSVVA